MIDFFKRSELVRRGLASDAVVALEHDRRCPIQEEQRIVIGLIEQPSSVDPRERALLVRADIDELDRREKAAENVAD